MEYNICRVVDPDSILNPSTSSGEKTSNTRPTFMTNTSQCRHEEQAGVVTRHEDSLEDSETYTSKISTIEGSDALEYRRSQSVENLEIAKKRRRRLVRKHVVGVVEDLSNVLCAINSVTSELRGVLNQIERVTSHIERSAQVMNASENDISYLKPSTSQESVQTFPQRSASCFTLRTTLDASLQGTAITSTDTQQGLSTSGKLKTGDDNFITTRNRPQRLDIIRPTVQSQDEPKTMTPTKVEMIANQPVTSRRRPTGRPTGTSVDLTESYANDIRTYCNSSSKEVVVENSVRCDTTSYRPCYNDATDHYNSTVNVNPQSDSAVTLGMRNPPVKSYTFSSIENILKLSSFETDWDIGLPQCDDDSSKRSFRQHRVSSARSKCSRSTSVPSSLSRPTGIGSRDKPSHDEFEMTDFHANYDRDINTWTTFAMVHIGPDSEYHDS